MERPYSIEYYSVIKKNEIVCFAGKMDGNGDHLVKPSKPGSERQRSLIFSHMWTTDSK
jgi:hypothetical protein